MYNYNNFFFKKKKKKKNYFPLPSTKRSEKK